MNINDWMTFAKAVLDGQPGPLCMVTAFALLTAVIWTFLRNVNRLYEEEARRIQLREAERHLAKIEASEKPKHELAEPEEKPKRGRVMLDDDGELLEIMEDEE